MSERVLTERINGLEERLAVEQTTAMQALDEARQDREEIKKLRKALEDIAGGMVPPGFLNGIESETPLSFRSRMWSWSQERAREALGLKVKP